mgnify:CR=1 FL=1
MDDVWDIGRVPPIKQLFPTEKPVPLLSRIIEASSNPGDVVLSPFMTADLTTGGRYTDGTGGKSGLLVVDRDGYTTWRRPSMVLERFVDILQNQVYLVARRRQVTARKRPAAQKTVAYGYGL